MRKPATFHELQTIQREHDLHNHTDIYTLPLFNKINHYALHFTKYAARLTPQKPKSETIAELERTYTDAMLISLSSANALNMDLDVEMRARFDKVPISIGNYVTKPKNLSPNQLRKYSRDILILSSGAMADTLEKRDHLDDVNSREILTRSISDIAEMLIYSSNDLDFDIVNACLSRRSRISELKIT